MSEPSLTGEQPLLPACPEDLEFQRYMAERGVTVSVPRFRPGWTLPEPIQVEGELASEALIRMRRTHWR